MRILKTYEQFTLVNEEVPFNMDAYLSGKFDKKGYESSFFSESDMEELVNLGFDEITKKYAIMYDNGYIIKLNIISGSFGKNESMHLSISHQNDQGSITNVYSERYHCDNDLNFLTNANIKDIVDEIGRAHV